MLTGNFVITPKGANVPRFFCNRKTNISLWEFKRLLCEVYRRRRHTPFVAFA
jgi:hypothetical protein